MLDQEDEGTRYGVWVALGVVFFVLVGVIGGVVVRHMNAKLPAVPAVAAMPVDATPAVELLDAPLSGDLVGTLHFAVGESALPADAAAALDAVARALAEAPARTLVLSGFHDPTGDPVANAELAKQRAIAARDALQALGADPARLKLRRPESTAGDGTHEEARRVEMRLVD